MGQLELEVLVEQVVVVMEHKAQQEELDLAMEVLELQTLVAVAEELGTGINLVLELVEDKKLADLELL
jgi:ribosomal protein L7Ae-like RNA K-turn-binding protein